jgi:Glycosyl hydrolase family 76
MPRGRTFAISLMPAAVVALAVALGGCSSKSALTYAHSGPLLSPSAAARIENAAPLSRRQYLALAEQGVAKTALWWDPKLHGYLAYLGDTQSRPLGTLWDNVSTFELLSEVAIAHPTRKALAAVESFGDSYQSYWNANLEPVPGYAPYPGDDGAHQATWYDDAGWLGLAFLDADKALSSNRYLDDAERSMAFIQAGGWDGRQGGDMWWDTTHQWRSGEALAADIDLAARLYQATGKAEYLRSATSWIAWANKHLKQANGVYSRTSSTPYGSEVYIGSDQSLSYPVGTKRGTSNRGARSGPGLRLTSRLPPGCKAGESTKACLAKLCKSHPKICHGSSGAAVTIGGGNQRAANAKPTFVAMPQDGEGAMVSAFVSLYQSTGQGSWLTEAEDLAGSIIKWLEPFDDGSEYDGITLRGFVTLYAADHDPRWYKFVTSLASVVIHTARSAPGVYLKPWGGGRSVPGAVPEMLRTDASSLMVFAALAMVAPPN